MSAQIPLFFKSIKDLDEYYVQDQKTVDLYGGVNADSVKHRLFWNYRFYVRPIKSFLKFDT